MTNSQSVLFEPLKVGHLTIKNRLVMAPLTRNRAGKGNIPSDLNKLYYSQRASAGLIISEASQISDSALGYPDTPGIHNNEQVAGWKKITEAVHAKGGAIFIQLWHVGRISHPSLLPNDSLPVAPSAIRPAGEAVTYEGMLPFVTPKELTIIEIEKIIDDYVNAAKNAKLAGFDGIEVHAANGYLLDQFIRDSTNKRTDKYGGDRNNRIRLLDEILTAVKQIWASDAIAVRISPENQFNDIHDSQPEETFNAVVEMLNGHNLAYLHVLEGDMLNNEKCVDYVALRKAYQGLYMANMGYHKQSAEEALKQGNADMIAFGKLYIANPDLVARFSQEEVLNEPDPATFYGGTEVGYTDYAMIK